MSKIIKNKKFKMEIFKTKEFTFEVREPYLTNGEFTTKEILDFIDRNSPYKKK